MSKKFTTKIAKQVALKSFGHVLDCVLGYTDPDYSLATPIEEFEQNFEEDLTDMGVVVNQRRLDKCSDEYKKLTTGFEIKVRKAYKNIYS